MARLQDATLQQGSGYHDQSDAVMVDVRASGQQGYISDLKAYHANAAYVRRNVIAIVMETPRGFSDLPQGEVWHATLKALVETGAQSIEGLKSTLNVEYVQNAIGASGEQQEDIAKVTRERSEVTISWVEKYGKPVARFLDSWITYLIGDPDTGVPAIIAVNDDVVDQLPDYYTMTVMFIEPDPLHKYVQEAWLVTNMAPKQGATREGRRDLTQAGESLTYSIPFTGMQQVGAGTNALAQQLLDQINFSGVNPNRREPFINAKAADAADARDGYADVVDRVAGTMIGG